MKPGFCGADLPQSVPAGTRRGSRTMPPSAVADTPAPEVPHPPRPENYRPPPLFDLGPDDHIPGADGVPAHRRGSVLPKTVVEQTDGELLRHLSIAIRPGRTSTAAKAALSMPRFGGAADYSRSVCWALQKDKAAGFDTNRNGLAEGASSLRLRAEPHYDRAAVFLSRARCARCPRRPSWDIPRSSFRSRIAVDSRGASGLRFTYASIYPWV